MSSLEPYYLIINEISNIRQKFSDYISRFQILLNKLKVYKKEKIENEKREVPYEIKFEAKKLSQECLRFISYCSTLVLEQAAWKYGHPQDLEKCEVDILNLQKNNEEEKEGEEKKEEKKIENENQNGKTEEKKEEDKPKVNVYERVVRFNYTAPERAALVEIISIIKSMERLLLKNSSLLIPLFHSVIHDELQEFIQITLVDMLNKTLKKKKNLFIQLY